MEVLQHVSQDRCWTKLSVFCGISATIMCEYDNPVCITQETKETFNCKGQHISQKRYFVVVYHVVSLTDIY
jgi:hypothetical protein